MTLEQLTDKYIKTIEEVTNGYKEQIKLMEAIIKVQNESIELLKKHQGI